MVNLKAIRVEKSYTIPQLVEMTGIPRRTLQDIEKRGDCLVSNALKLADALGVSMDELCTTAKGKDAP